MDDFNESAIFIGFGGGKWGRENFSKSFKILKKD
jgi:hypothetical protein